MVEHVGHEYMDEFFSSCEYHLAKDGLFVLQVRAIIHHKKKLYRLCIHLIISRIDRIHARAPIRFYIWIDHN